MTIIEKNIAIPSPEVYINFFGANEKNLSMLERQFQLHLSPQGGQLTANGDIANIEMLEAVLANIHQLTIKRHKIDKTTLVYAIELAKRNELDCLEELLNEIIIVNSHGKALKCKSLGQRDYIRAITKNTLSIATGPAGTGKTYLAMAMAVKALRNKEVDRIILTRPAVEAGEKLGFLPGDLSQKVDPYLRPLFDALYEFIGVDHYQSLLEKGIIEIAPLAYMRGRTLSNAFIILDEAQNTSPEQMKMFLTRFGNGSKVVVTGDLTQIDLPFGKQSGLQHAIQVLQNIEDIAIIQLGQVDVVRNELVQRIVKAYDIFENRKMMSNEHRK